MKSIIIAMIFGAVACSAFAPSSIQPVHTSFAGVSTRFFMTTEPEPEGGDDISAIDTMPNSRMKNMGAVDGKTTEDGSQIFTFWLSAEAEGKLVKGLLDELVRDAKKNANFPGFRKGMIPPYAMPKMNTFAIEEGIVSTIEAAVDAYGLQVLAEDKDVEVHEDVTEIANGYKLGTTVEFTATFKATFNPEKKQVSEEEVVEQGEVKAEIDFVDAELVDESSEKN